MKTKHKLLTIAASVLAMAACGNIDDLEERVDKIENRVAALEKVAETINGNIKALQAIASGQAINSVEEKDGAYILNLSNGQTITLNQGNVGIGKAPVMSVDKDGYWMVDYQDGKGAIYLTDDEGQKIVAVGQNGVTPMFGVNEDGYWTVSYNGGESFAPVLDVKGEKVKAVAGSSTEDSYFAGVEYDNESLVLTLKNGEQYKVPVVGGFLCKINGVSDEEIFRKGEKKTFSVEQKGIASTIITAPKGWEAYLTSAVLSIQAPSDVETKAALADTRTDVSVVAISEAGHIAIAKVRVKVDGSVSVYDPAASVALVEATVSTLKFNVTTENAASWYWMVRKSSEAAPGVSELISDGTKGTDAVVTVEGLMGQTEYVMYVLPCGEVNNGPIAAFKATTADYSNLYEAWEAGAELTIGSRTYSKAKNGKGTLVKNADQVIWGSWFNDGTFGAVFLDEGASAVINNTGYKKSVVIFGNVPGTRPTVTVKAQFGVEGTGVDFACKNVNIKMNDGIGKVIYTNTLMGKMVLDDCGLDLRYPLLTRFNTGGTSVGTMEGIDIIDCDVCVNWANDNIAFSKTAAFLLNTHAGGADCGDLIVKNNVFWSKDGKKEFHICAGPWVKDTKFNDVVLEQNTFYNVHNGELASETRKKALIVTSTVNSFSMSGNIAYDTNPDSKTVASRAHFTWLYADKMTLAGLKAVTTNSTSNLIDYAEYCSILTGEKEGVDWGLGLTSLIKWQGSGRQIIESWTNPFKSENAETGVFETLPEYKSYGPQR